jgi:hypothetical protein
MPAASEQGQELAEVYVEANAGDAIDADPNQALDGR